ncbi:protein cordon-bleu-like isoform X1 [Littorina saxatilis]|uniref:protein cordon-bleu-like isoform X1 n=1 Tax=Littorina saxatilis TaxID=31220 RepID=UPI0038B67641
MLKWTKKTGKSMSTAGVKRAPAPTTPQGGMGQTKLGGEGTATSSNGSAPTPLTYSSGEPADDVNMNEVDDKVTLDVYLPSGKTSIVTVDSNIPMMDLLVNLASQCKVSPTGHTLQVIDEETSKAMSFKANQTIGSLGVTSVYIVQKNKKPDWSKPVKANKAAKSFEITQRFTINLPGGQKAVMRISPQLTLEQVFARVCQDKSLDSRRYTLQHPANPLSPLDLKATIAQSKLSEINLIHAGASTAADSSRSMPDLHRGSTMAAAAPRDPGSWYMPEAGETKKKRGFLSFLSKSKDKKFKPQDAHYNMETSSAASHQAVQARRSTTPPPTERRSSDAPMPARPKTMYVTSSAPVEESGQAQGSAPPRDIGSSTLKGAGKKRPAPRPPQAQQKPANNVKAPVASAGTPTTSASASAAAPPASSRQANDHVSVSVKAEGQAAVAAAGLSRLHSRNSSDSSGYHELTLSGAESPEASRVPTTFKTSIDTTSIESSDNLNGDSGIQEMSPVSESGGSRLAVEGAGKGASSKHYSSSPNTLERPDMVKPLPSTKKKKAPPPPPKAKSTPVESQRKVSGQAERVPPEISVSIPEHDAEEPPPPLTVEVDVTNHAEVHMDTERAPSSHEDEDDNSEAGEAFNLNDILDAVNFEDEPLRTSTTSRTQELGEDLSENDKMAMMETASVLSEDVEVLDDVRSRPCEFIAPPPPVEPPPEECPPADLRGTTMYVDRGTVVGDDNVSLAPASLKNSPVATHRRTDSRTSLTSVGSVDTIQGLSLDFEQTIAAGQQALDSDPWFEEEGSGYSEEMARFVADMTRLTDENQRATDASNISSNDTSMSLPDTESASDTGSVIRHGDPYHARGDSKDSQQSSLSSLGRPGDSSSVDGDRERGVPAVSNAFNMMEEIQAPMETVPPPLEFQNGGGGGEEEEEDEQEEEEEEEVTTTVTEEYIVPMGPSGFNYSAAVKVSEEEEKRGNTTSRKTSDSSSGVFRAEPLSILQRAERDAAEEAERKRREPPKPAKKEEFVLTSEDLSSVSLVPLRPKVYIPPKEKHAPVQAPTPPPPEPEPEADYAAEPAVGPGSPDRRHMRLAYVSNHGHVQPVSSHEGSRDFSAPSYHRADSGRQRAEEQLSGQGQVSSLVLPNMRITGVTEPMAFSDDDRSSESSNDHVYRSTAKLATDSRAAESGSESGSERADSRRMSNASTHSQAGVPALDELQQQYSNLQEQFVLWQQQLQQNQTLLASQTNNDRGAGDVHSDAALKTLQMQVQMQQQMMQQLQMSMQALAVQQQQQQQQQQPQNGLYRERPPPPAPLAAAPPPPPPAPLAAKAAPKVVKPKTPSSSTRFQPQLDPREELMIAIRGFGGRNELNTVPVKATKWVHSNK